MYSMKGACSILGIPYETLKFYCKEGLVPNVKRNQSNHRVFDDHNIAWLKGLLILKKCGMSLKEMKIYLHHCLKGEETIPQRKEMLDAVTLDLIKRKKEIDECLAFIDNKQAFYDGILAGEIEYTSNLVDTSEKKVLTNA